MCFVSFSCLIALARISRTMLNSSDESQYPCLVFFFSLSCFDLRGKTFILLLLSMVFADGDYSHERKRHSLEAKL